MLSLRCGIAQATLVFATVSVVSAQRPIDVWIGTGGGRLSRGIYHTRLDLKTGRLGAVSLAAEVRGPGFLAMHPDGKTLYAVGTLDGKPSLIAYEVATDGKTKRLVLRNAVETGDGGAAHVAVDRTGRTVLTAQYGGGSVAVFSINDDGSIRERTQLVEHHGGSLADPRRQKSPHPHWTGFSPDNRFAFVPDLGLDKVMIYRLDAAKSRLEEHGFGQLPPGSGPRHMKFHPSGKWIYVLNELDLSVSVFDYDAQKGAMTIKQTLPTVPKEQLQKERFKSCSEIRVHPSGKFVYAANRGHDTITVFRVDQATGEVGVVEREFVRGATPRNFNLDPSAQWLIAAGQASHTLASFAVDSQTGEITFTGSIASAPIPICVLFGPQ